MICIWLHKMYTINFPAGVSFTEKIKTSCGKSKYERFSSLQEATTECGKDSDCSGVYDSRCDGKYWYLCPYDSTYPSTSSCTYMKGGKVRRIYWKISAHN